MKLHRLLPLLLVLTLMPSPAQAQGVLRWLGRLSGPGPFWGLGAEVRVACFGVDKRARVNPNNVQAETESMGARFPCPKATYNPLDEHATVYFSVSGAIAESNPLDYQDAESQDESDAVRMLKVGTSIDWTVHRMFDLGTGFGIAYFGGPRFDNFSLGYVQPVRVSLRPLLWSRAVSDDRGWLLVSANWQILLGTLDGADFGAPSDPFVSKNEQDVELGVSVDVLRLLRTIRK